MNGLPAFDFGHHKRGGAVGASEFPYTDDVLTIADEMGLKEKVTGGKTIQDLEKDLFRYSKVSGITTWEEFAEKDWGFQRGKGAWQAVFRVYDLGKCGQQEGPNRPEWGMPKPLPASPAWAR